MAAQISKAKVIKVPLTAAYSHDVKKMVAADPNAGLIYLVNPNNPTGTITPREEILWGAGEQAQGLDPAGRRSLHPSLRRARRFWTRWAAGKDIVVLRTFSKIYGMAGIRCGVAIARPDLLDKLTPYYQNAMPVTALAAARASIADKTLIPTRKKWIADSRNETLTFLKANGYKPVGNSVSNCFMIDTGRPAQKVIAALQKEKVYIGRIWPVWPNAVRVSVGSPDDMAKFRVAFKKVMSAPMATASAADLPHTGAGKKFLS